MGNKKFKNKKKENFINNLPKLDLETSKIEKRCKFNFSYFDPSQSAGQDFKDWDNQDKLSSLSELLNKIKNYSKEALSYWRHQKVGTGKYRLNILEYYEKFPLNSDFRHPNHVPHDVIWARFRLGYKVRLVGFVIPDEFALNDHLNQDKEFKFDQNTFYVVFLDKDHHFYTTEME